MSHARPTACTIVLLAIAGSLSACAPPGELPADWPVRGLTLPPQSSQVEIKAEPIFDYSIPDWGDSSEAVEDWTVTFACRLGWQDALFHMERRLVKAGFTVDPRGDRALTGLAPLEEQARLYIHPERRLAVLLHAELAILGYEGFPYVLQIAQFPPAAD